MGVSKGTGGMAKNLSAPPSSTPVGAHHHRHSEPAGRGRAVPGGGEESQRPAKQNRGGFRPLF